MATVRTALGRPSVMDRFHDTDAHRVGEGNSSAEILELEARKGSVTESLLDTDGCVTASSLFALRQGLLFNQERLCE